MARLFVLVLCFVFVISQNAMAADSEVEDLKRRVDELEKRLQKTVTEELGHKRIHPVHSIYGLSVSGSITMTAQGASKIKGDTGVKGDAAISADLAIESPVGENGRAVLVFDFQRGAGIQNLPSFLTAPNGNATGPNADLESFNDNSLHVTQVYYEHDVTPSLAISVGQLDITGYFDANNFANDERSQFLANTFVNNPTIEFGGSDNFYAPGVRLTYFPVENIDISLGAFEGNGDYANTFDNPFLMAELNVALKPMGREGNYRLYYWHRSGRPDADATTPLVAENLANPNDTALLKADNNGVGLSIDQAVTDTLGFWLRAGMQREKVAQFDRFIGGGLNLSGELFGRQNDSIGFGYGATFMGDDYRDYQRSVNAAFDDGIEHYLELYYNYAIAHSEPDQGFHITPDIQYVINPGGDEEASKVFIYGVRLQTYF